jgi:hypothetical protein
MSESRAQVFARLMSACEAGFDSPEHHRNWWKKHAAEIKAQPPSMAIGSATHGSRRRIRHSARGWRVDDRLAIAAMAMQGMLSNHECANDERDIANWAFRYADALLELSKVPAPSGGPVAPPPGSDSPDSAAQEVVTGAATAHAEQDAAAQVAPPGEPALPPSATAGENPARPVSECDEECFAHHKYDFNPHIAPPRPSSRKAKPGTPCGGPSCRETQQWWIHDPRTCPLYAGKAAG